MTNPVTKDDIVMACVKFLRAQADVVAVVGQTDTTPMIFGYSLWTTQLEGSQSTAIFVTSDGGWAAPNPHNTMRFPRITVNIWADPIRDDGGNEAQPGEVMRRINHAFETADAHLHRAEGGVQWWGDIRTVSCTRLTEPLTYRVPDGDGIVRLAATYAVSQG